jgi:phosphoribosyl-AMP cyclohydrolase
MTSEEQKTRPLAAKAREAILEAIHFDDKGLVAAIAQEASTGEVLMLAWMNREAVIQTLESGEAHYWSRSRGKLWRKGETSGQVQTLQDFRIDCDGDTILLTVAQTGVACHTGRHSCFFRAPRDADLTDIIPVTVSPDRLYGKKVAADGDGEK